jgi:hypothetical protein
MPDRRERIAAAASADPDFSVAARWMFSRVGFICTDDEIRSFALLISDGSAVALDNMRPELADIVIAGTADDWDYFLCPDTPSANLNRFIRQNRFHIAGDRVLAMRHWLALYVLADAWRESVLAIDVAG